MDWPSFTTFKADLRACSTLNDPLQVWVRCWQEAVNNTISTTLLQWKTSNALSCFLVAILFSSSCCYFSARYKLSGMPFLSVFGHFDSNKSVYNLPPGTGCSIDWYSLEKICASCIQQRLSLSDWNKSAYLFGLSDEKAVVRRDHQRCWSAIIYLTEQFFNRSIEIRFNNELHCISFVRSCPWEQKGKG